MNSMKMELKDPSSSNLAGAIFMSILAFVVPIIGIGFSIYLLKGAKRGDFPSWVKIIATLSIMLQTIMILWLTITIVLFNYTEVIEIDGTVETIKISE